MASITLTWTASAGASSGNYRIKYWRSTTPESVVVIDSVQGTSYTINNLTDSVTYNGTVELKCADGSYSGAINWSLNTTPSSGGGAGGGGSLVTAINGQTTANCSYGASGTITIAANDSKKVQIGTFYYSGSGTQQGATLVVRDSITNDNLISISASAPTLYTNYTTVSTYILLPGTYNYTLTNLPCFNGSGSSTISLVQPV